MFISVLFTTANRYKQHSYPSNEEWTKKTWCIYKMEYNPAIRNQANMNFAGKWKELMNIILSEVTQSQNGMYDFCIYLQVDISHEIHISCYTPQTKRG